MNRPSMNQVVFLFDLTAVIPAQAGIQDFQAVISPWIPAFAAMTTFYCVYIALPVAIQKVAEIPSLVKSSQIVTPAESLAEA